MTTLDIILDNWVEGTPKPTIISHSEMYTFDTCPRSYYYAHILNLRPAKMSDAIDTGTKGHKLYQAFHVAMAAGMNKEIALEHVTKQANKMADRDSKTPDFPLLAAWTMVTNYIRETDFKAEVIMAENRFLIPASSFSDDPLLSDVQIGFTPDVVIKRTGNFVVVKDAKFIQRAWSESKIERVQQTKLYQILLNHMGYNVTNSSIVFFNTKTGKITEIPTLLGINEAGTIIRDFIRGIKDVVKFKQQSAEELVESRRILNYNTCQYCFFNKLCTAEAKGQNVSNILKYEFVKSDYDYSR